MGKLNDAVGKLKEGFKRSSDAEANANTPEAGDALRLTEETNVSSANSAPSVVADGLVKIPPKLCLALSISAIVLAIIPGLTVSGLLLGVATIVFSWYLGKQRASVESINGVRWLSAIALVLGLLMTSAYSGAFASHNNAIDSDVVLADTGSSKTVETVEVVKEAPCLSIEIGDRNDKPVPSLQVTVTGSTKNGLEINEVRSFETGLSRKLDYPAGSYTFSYEAFASTDGKKVYKSNSVVYSYDGKESKTVKLPLLLDEEATAEIAAADEAAKAQAEAEAAAAAQREAEEKAAAEAVAAAKAQSAAKQQQPSSSGAGTVYIASSGNGSKYHSYSGCSNMKGTISMSESEAKSLGYTRCKKCW